jgi:hypothetical protein
MNGSGWRTRGVVVGVLVLAAACSRGEGEPRPASGAREQASNAAGRSAEAYEKASQEQKDLAAAQNEVQKAERELQEAREKVLQERGEAQQAQQHAQQSAQQSREAQAGAQQASEQQRAQQSAQDARAQELQASGREQGTATGGEPQDGAQERSIQGHVVRADDREIVLRPPGGQPDLRLGVGPDTQVTVGGQQASPAQLTEGTEVRASYDESGGAPRAKRIEATGSSGTEGAPPEQPQPAPGRTQ